MFYKCGSLVYLNLSKINTDSVKDMSYILYDMNALKYLDISNFNMIKCNSFNEMFSNVDNIRYIDINNLGNDKIISSKLNKSELFYICQSLFIISNSNAYNCWEYNNTTDQCEYIPPSTILTTIPTTIITIIPTTIITIIPTTIITTISTIK